MVQPQTEKSIEDIAINTKTVEKLIDIIQLSPKVFSLLDNYMQQRRQHRDPQFRKSMMPEIEKDIECWEG